MNVRLCIMTKELARQYYSRFEMDPMLFMDLSQYQSYVVVIGYSKQSPRYSGFVRFIGQTRI